MIDFRYHALSLIAVLVALAIGVLLGVAIGDEGLVSSAERALRSDIQERVEEARDEARALEERLERRDLYEERTFQTLVGSLLESRRVAVVFLHEDDRAAFGPVRESLDAAGAELASVSTFREPVDLAELSRLTDGTRFEEMDEDDELALDFARRAGTQLVGGGRLIRTVRRELFTNSSGTLNGAEAVVIVRGEPDDLPDERAAFIDAFVEGLDAFGTPVVGVEVSAADPSQIPWYEDRDLASVDNVDEPAGQASLVYALAGVADGAYGFKETADALVPEALGGG